MACEQMCQWNRSVVHLPKAGRNEENCEIQDTGTSHNKEAVRRQGMMEVSLWPLMPVQAAFVTKSAWLLPVRL